jgi:serine/threonine-protein kinase
MTAPQSQAAPVSPGDVLAGKYRVERVLGQGGMGVVVAAKHLHMEQRVAIKFLLPDLASHPETVARFAREANAAVKIQSEHVGRVIDVGTLESGAPYMVMEYLEGSDLADVVARRGPLPWHEVVEYVLQACEAIAEAHVAGIVHRDLKPANLFLIRRADGSPCVKVLDFGISKAADAASGSALTQTAAMMGSPKYMSPEQLKSARDVDARTDIWALGVILYELLSGEGAFRADTMPQLYVAIIQDPPQPLRRTDVPPGLHQVILRCLEKDPARRFQSVAELAAALHEFAPVHARRSVERISRIQMARAETTAGFPGSQSQQQQSQHQALANTGPSQIHGAPPAHPHAHPGQQHPQQQQQQQNQNLAPTYQSAPAGYGPSPVPPAPSPMGQPGYPAAQGGYAQPGYSQQRPAQQQMPHHGGYQQPYGHAQTSAPSAPQKPSMSAATIVLITLVAVFAVGGGGCVLCVCVAAATQDAQQRAP